MIRDNLAAGDVSYVISDTPALPITYEFVGISTIGGAPPSPAAFGSVAANGTANMAFWTIGEVVTDTEDDVAVNAVTPAIRIRYFARLNNDGVTDSGDTLQNDAELTFTSGETGLPVTANDTTAIVTATESDLSATKTLSNVTGGKAPADPPAFGDSLEYIVTVVNGGNARAYDINLVDTLPPELTLDGGFAPTATIDGLPVAGFVATPAGAPTGSIRWGRTNGDNSLALSPGSFLTLTYRADVTTPLPGGGNIDNEVWVDWTSLVDPAGFERTGTGCPTITPPNDYCFGPAIASGTSDPIAPPAPLLKENTQLTASVGEAFTYQITIPSTPYAFGQFDLRISDDLLGSAADLRLLNVTKISGSQPWVPVNTGTPTAPVIEDTTIGIDIPAGEQIVLELEVVLENTPGNVTGLSFTNTASYVYNFFDADPLSQRPGLPGITPPMTIVGPDTITVDKIGPAGMTLASPGSFTLDVQNTGTGPAWNLRLIDQLPTAAPGGTCDTAPTVLSAQVFQSDGVTPVSGVLAAGTDYAVAFRPSPVCELDIAMLSAAAVVGASERLLVTYEARLDATTPDGVLLTNVAGATEWASADGTNPATAGDVIGFARVLTDGTVGTVDHEDAHTTAVALPAVQFDKTVTNVTTGETPATSASPGDTLRYQLRVENLSATPLSDFSLVDELDSLNAPPVFAAGTLLVTSVPAGADSSATDPNGGAAGTGLLDVATLSLPNLNDVVVVEFEVQLAPVLPNGTQVTNQSELQIFGTTFVVSDDPAVGGATDPTVVPIASGPAFQVEKTSSYLDGDPALLLAGERLRYTITVDNIGSDDATDATLRDAIPVNTSYIAGVDVAQRRCRCRRRGRGGPVRVRHGDQRPQHADAGRHRCGGCADRDADLRRVGRRRRARRHDHLEPGLRQRGDRWSRRSALRRPGHRDARRSDPRRGRQRAAAVRAQERRDRDGRRHHRPGRSGRCAPLHDHRLQQWPRSGNRGHHHRRGPDQHDLGGQLAAAQRRCGRRSRWRHLAARGRHPDRVLGPAGAPAAGRR